MFFHENLSWDFDEPVLNWRLAMLLMVYLNRFQRSSVALKIDWKEKNWEMPENWKLQTVEKSITQ